MKQIIRPVVVPTMAHGQKYLSIGTVSRSTEASAQLAADTVMAALALLLAEGSSAPTLPPHCDTLPLAVHIEQRHRGEESRRDLVSRVLNVLIDKGVIRLNGDWTSVEHIIDERPAVEYVPRQLLDQLHNSQSFTKCISDQGFLRENIEAWRKYFGC